MSHYYKTIIVFFNLDFILLLNVLYDSPALRMNASFPYISPFIELPTSPAIEVMDAGLSDNFGTSDALRFITTFEKWIKENMNKIEKEFNEVLMEMREARAM